MTTGSTGSVFSTGLQLQDRYRLDEVISVSDATEVWKAHDEVLERAVAIKLLHPHLSADSELIRRFRDEAIAAARLSHPHIAPTYDAGYDRGCAYVVLGLLDGPSLAEILREKKLDESSAFSIAAQVADALEHAHKHRLYHGGVKASNVFVIDDDHRVLLSDFGIAKAIAHSTANKQNAPAGRTANSPALPSDNPKDEERSEDLAALGYLLHDILCSQRTESIEEEPNNCGIENLGTCAGLSDGSRRLIQGLCRPQTGDAHRTAGEVRDELVALEKSARSISPTAPGGPRRVPIGLPKTPKARSRAAEEPVLNTGSTVVASGNVTKSEPVVQSSSWEPSTVTVARETRTVDLPDKRERLARRRAVAAVTMVVVAVVLAVALGRYVGSLGSPPSPSPSPSPNSPEVAGVSSTSALSFDPAGDKQENQEQAALVIDGKPETYWSTETYSSREFGNLKPGLGLVVSLDRPSALGHVQVNSPSGSDWSAKVFLSDSPKSSLEAWGEPSDAQSGLGNSASFDLRGAKGSAVLVWITDLGSGNRLTISEIRITK